MITKLRTIICIIALATGIAGCSSSAPPTPPAANLATSPQSETNPTGSPTPEPDPAAPPEQNTVQDSDRDTTTATKPKTTDQANKEEKADEADLPFFTPGTETERSQQANDDPPLFDPAEIFNPKPQATPLPSYVPPEIQIASAHLVKKSNKGGKPVALEKFKIKGIPLYKMVIDLDDPQTYITLGLPHNATEANSAQVTHGDEAFAGYVKRYNAALVANGTFFSKDEEKRVMGNIVTEGKFRKYSQWENYGTTLGIKANNELEMVTAREEGQPDWTQYWFSVTCGPRLLKQGEVSVSPEIEGFRDSHVFTIGPRSAIGFNRKKHQIIYATFLRGLSLDKEAELMKALGCDEAMNLDGGASRAVAANNCVVIEAGRPLTNVLVVYDSKHPAPRTVTASWTRFQEGERPTPP